MKGKTIDIILYLAFWSLYGPLSVIMWYYEGGSLFKLGIALLIGLGLILGFLFFRTREVKRRTVNFDAEPEVNKKSVDDSTDFEGFRVLFSQNDHGGGSI